MTEQIQNQLNLSDAYRSARNKTAIFCGLGLAWSAAQFEFRKVSLGGLGEFDLSTASIALVISACILYSFIICITEYAMQPKNVRRWSLACFDFNLSLNLVRGTFLMLAASGLNRSVSNAGYIVAFIILFFVASLVLECVGTIALTPLMIFIQQRQGRHGIASRVIEAAFWARVTTWVLAIIVLISLGLASLYYSPLYKLWQIPPDPITIIIVTVTAILVLISIVLGDGYLNKLFAFVEKDESSGITTQYNKHGRIVMTKDEKSGVTTLF